MPYRPTGSRNWHYDFQIKGRRFHGSCGTEDYEEAKAIEAEKRVQAKADPKTRGIYTINEALGTYARDVAQYQTSYRTTKSQAKNIIAAMKGATRIDLLSNGDLIRFIALRRAKVANATVNREIDLLGRACRHMVKFHGGKLAEDLDFRAGRLKEPKERVRELSWDEQDRLFKSLRLDLHPFVKFALMTGARKETITELTWDAVHFETERLRFDIKGDDVMFFPMNHELRALLSSLPRGEGDHAPFVFTYQNQITKQRHRIVTGGGGLDEDWREALELAEILNFRFHDLRHTFATRILRKTRNIKLVSMLLGHKSIETTMRYAHVLDEDLRQGLDDFSALKSPESRKKSRRKNENSSVATG